MVATVSNRLHDTSTDAAGPGVRRAGVSTYADLLIQALRQGRRQWLHLQRERIRHRDTRSAYHAAVALTHDLHREISRKDATIARLRDELRRCTAPSGSAS